MKMKYAKEKSEYAQLIWKLMDGGTLNLELRLNHIARLKTIEDSIKEQGDEIIFIVTTRDTNPMSEKTAPPMEIK